MKPSDLRAWVSAGNTAILLCPYANAHLDELRIGLDFAADFKDTGAQAAVPGPSGDSLRLRFTSTSRFITKDANVPVTTLYATGDRPAVVSAGVGLGKVILIADSHLVTNLGIADEDNALFLLQAAAPALRNGEVIFDETSTRVAMREPGVMEYARKAGLQPLFVELGLLALLGLWHVASRTAPPVTQRVRIPPAVPDYVTGRARLYEKAQMGRSAIKALTETLRDALHRTPGIPEAANARAAGLLDRAKRLERFRNAKTGELVELSRAIHDFMNEVIWKPGRRFRLGKRIAPLKRK
ncbi:MAG TPA: DUF4350 domain-containing protein [Planctomycetota bacterium]|nr:DUF4350 domain-containing protein [Planctomycetota bacterium]